MKVNLCYDAWVEVEDKRFTVSWPGGVRHCHRDDPVSMLRTLATVTHDLMANAEEVAYKHGYRAGYDKGYQEGEEDISA